MIDFFESTRTGVIGGVALAWHAPSTRTGGCDSRTPSTPPRADTRARTVVDECVSLGRLTASPALDGPVRGLETRASDAAPRTRFGARRGRASTPRPGGGLDP